MPLFMMMAIVKVRKVKWSTIVRFLLIGISSVVFLIAASQGYLTLYYKEVSLVFVNGMAKLQKVYGPLHKLYYIYLFAYFMIMLGVILYAVLKKKITSYKHAGLLAIVVFFNIAIWLVEQFVNWDFEFLSISYICSELLLLFLYGMIQDYEAIAEQGKAVNGISELRTWDIEKIKASWPEVNDLSNREMDVFLQMLNDKKRKEIAEELCITENTVKKHISSIFTKLNITSRTELLEKIQ